MAGVGEPSITPAYEATGVEGFYEANGASYRNPHEDEVRDTLVMAAERWAPDLTSVLDLACGSGEATLELMSLGAVTIAGIDPYTQAAYHERTGLDAEPLTFADIANGALEGRSYSTVVCSYALHLCETSRLAAVCIALVRVTPTLMILSPHKRPVIGSGWGWSDPDEFVHRRVHARLYRSMI
jgi:SAM-dependent methyltransferase